MTKIAVIPVAGFGTRMLPASKSIPKEMLPLADKPMIHFIFEECRNAGIEHIVLVSHAAKTCLEDYFDRNAELEQQLADGGKVKLLHQLNDINSSGITVTSVRQQQPLGLGHAVHCAKNIIGDQPFAVILPDVLLTKSNGDQDCNILGEMIHRNQLTGASQILVEPVEESLVSNYGIVGGDFLGDENSQSLELNQLVEKPSLEDAPSNLAVVGRYVFNPSILDYLSTTKPGVGGEIQLTDAIMEQVRNESVQGFKMIGQSQDCGRKMGYYKAFVEQVLNQPGPDSDEFKAWLYDQVKHDNKSKPNKPFKLVV